MPALQTAAQDFRRGVAVKGLAQKLFDPSVQSSLDPALITQILVAAGIKVPVGVRIGADTAQILLAGGALVSDVEKGADVMAYMKPSGSLLKGVTDILAVTGLLPKDSPAAVALNLAGDLALVVASGGLNVLADISLVLDLIGAFFSGPPDRTEEYTAYAKAMAQSRVNQWFNARETGQLSTAAKYFQAYQSGSLHAFDFMGKIAEASPDLFLNYFPELKYFIPPIIAHQCESYRFQKTDRAGFRSRDYDITQTACINYSSLFENKGMIQSGIFNKFVIEPAYPYQILSSLRDDQVKLWGYPAASRKLGVNPHEHPVQRIQVADMAILSLFPPYFQFITDDFDIKPLLKSLFLTPADLGYRAVSDALSLSTTQAEWQTLHDADESGNIGGLLSSPKASQIVTEFGIIPHFPEDQVDAYFRRAYPALEVKAATDPKYDPPVPRRQIDYGTSPGDSAAVNLPAPPSSPSTLDIHQDPNGYRNIRNFWGCVQMAREIAKSSYFQDYDVRSRIEGFLSTADELDAKHRALQQKSVMRKMNALARQRIASYYNTTPDKLRWKNTRAGELAAVLPR